jgi:hypothetical protein
MSKQGEFETAEAAAKRCDVSTNYVTALARQGRVRAGKLGKVWMVHGGDVSKACAGLKERAAEMKRRLGNRGGHQFRWKKEEPVVQSAPAIKPEPVPVAEPAKAPRSCSRVDVVEAKLATLESVVDLQRNELRRLVAEAVEQAFKKAFA